MRNTAAEMERITHAYFNQSTHYSSESRGEPVEIVTMAPTYAGNAAEKLLREARQWAPADAAWPQLWMVNRPLFKALAKRAGL